MGKVATRLATSSCPPILASKFLEKENKFVNQREGWRGSIKVVCEGADVGNQL